MGSTKDELKQRELYIIKMLRKGHSRKWVASQLEEKYNLAPSTAVNVVNEMVNMITIQRAYEAGQKVITSIDGTLDRAVNNVGKV